MHFQYMRKSWAWFQHFCQFCFKGWMGVSEVQCNALIMWLWAWLKTMNCIIYYINVKDANDILPYLAPVNVVPQEAPKICQRKFCDRILPGLHHLCQNPYCQCYIYVIFNVRILCVSTNTEDQESIGWIKSTIGCLGWEERGGLWNYTDWCIIVTWPCHRNVNSWFWDGV